MSNHEYAKDFYLLRSENILKKLDDLEEANDCLRIQISAREEVCNRLESNWNKLREYISTEWYSYDNDSVEFEVAKDILNKMQELQGSDE
nr:MAG TPA: hypothetical protein [Bacteriophage sp.]